MQCDTAVTSDELLSPDELADYEVSGYGGSDLSPAMLRARRRSPRAPPPIVTDGDIAYPPSRCPTACCGCCRAHGSADFRPPYGRVVTMQRADAMKVVQELVAYFDRRGELSQKQLRKLLDQGFLAADAPPTMLELCEPVGATFYFRVRGETEGPLWGTDIYTGDSSLAVAAVHAGLVKPGETAIIKVTVVAPPPHIRARRATASPATISAATAARTGYRRSDDRRSLPRHSPCCSVAAQPHLWRRGNIFRTFGHLAATRRFMPLFGHTIHRTRHPFSSRCDISGFPPDRAVAGTTQ